MATNIFGDCTSWIKRRGSAPLTGTDTRRVEADAGTFDGGVWSNSDGSIYPTSPTGTPDSGRVRFSTHVSGTVIPAGAHITGVTLRITLGNGDNQNYTFNILEFNTTGLLSAVVTLAALNNGVVIKDDATEKTISLNVPTSWDVDHPERWCLQFNLAASPGGSSVIVCSLDISLIDMYIDVDWST